MKKIFRLLLMALPMLLGLASCVVHDNPVIDKGAGGETVVAPDVTQPTEDQMAVTVTKDVPTAALRTLDEGSTAAALVKRLSKVTATIGSDTRMVLVPGSMFADGTDMTSEELDAIVRLSLNGGYLAIERPTAQQLFNFAVLYAAKLFDMQVLTYQELYDMDEAAAKRAASSSEIIQRTKARLANIEQIAKRRGADGLDDVQAEILSLGPTDYFMEDPFTEEVTTTMHTDDGKGNTTQDETITSKQARTAYISGELADAYAEWLNDTETKYEQKSDPRRAMNRASGSSAINEIMDASETFRYVGEIHSTNTKRSADSFFEGVKMTVRSWGVHDMESNKDYYYVKQNITVRNYNFDLRWMDPRPSVWWECWGYGSYNRWFGHFTSQYHTSMDLVGNGSIHLEAAYPSTDNGSSSTSITVGSSSSQSRTVGMTIGGSMGFSGMNPSLSFNASGSISTGTTTGNSFSMGMSTTNKDLSVSKNTQDTKVYWTYKTTLPQYYEDRTNLKSCCHTWPSAMLLSEIDMANEICWSVDNPSGQYTINITSDPQDAALLYKYEGKWNAEHTYAYTDTKTATYSPTLQEPNRAMQKWRMFITINEWAGSPVVGAQGYLQSAVHEGFPDLFAPQFSVADKMATSLNVITAIIDYSKKAFTQNLDILRSYATSLGIKKYTISWRCDDANVTTREGFVVTAE